MDYLPLEGSFSVQQFCDGAEKSRRNARRSYIAKFELYKDTRVEDWWRHEMLVFTVVHPDRTRRSFLVFERGRPEDPDVPQTLLQFVFAGFKGEAEDRMEFMEPQSDDMRRKIEHSARVLEVEIKANAFNLLALATIIKAGPYYGGYSSYHLFSANCWSWARGLTLDIAIIQHKAIDVARLNIGEEAGAAMTAEELQVCMSTQYGAWGRLLLDLTTAETRAIRDRNGSEQGETFYDTVYNTLDYRVQRLHFAVARTVLYCYTVLGFLSRYREVTSGPSYWVTSFRRLTVHPDRVLDERDRDITRLPEGPNFRGVLPSRSVVDPILIKGLYTPGRYPLTFVTVTLGPTETISSVHIYVSTAFPSGGTAPLFIRRDGAVKCTIMRQGENGSLFEVGNSRHLELRATSSRAKPWPSNASIYHYTGVARIDGSDEFVRRIQSGDTVILWADASPGQVQYPRYASLNVVTKKPRFGLMDLGFLFGFSLKSGALYRYVPLPPILVVAILTMFYVVDHNIKDWAHSAVTKVTNILLATSVPLPLPPDRDTNLDFTLPDFLSHCKKADKTILDSPLESVLLRQNLAGSATLTVDFEHNGAGYTANIFVAPPKYDIWHYLSFLTTSHRLERDAVELSCRKEEGAWANAEDPTESSVKIRFKPKAEVTFATVVDLLRKAESRYWFHFWNNAREWTWPWWFIRSIANPLNKEVIASVQLDGGSEAQSLEGASFLLSRNKEEWRSAISHDYGNNMLEDARFIVTRTRAIHLIILFVILQQMLSPFIHSVWNGIMSSMLRRVSWPLCVLGIQ